MPTLMIRADGNTSGDKGSNKLFDLDDNVIPFTVPSPEVTGFIPRPWKPKPYS